MASTVWYAWMKGKVLPEERSKREEKKKKKGNRCWTSTDNIPVGEEHLG